MPDRLAPNVHLLHAHEHRDAARIAIDWLADRHRKGWHGAINALAEAWGLAPEAGAALDEAGTQMLTVNAGEWLLARGQIHVRGGLREVNAYLLGPEGPYLSPLQQRWIAQLRERPLRLYRVSEVRAGAGLTLLDEIDDDAEPIEVHEVSASRSARPGMLIAARIMTIGPAQPQHVLSGAIYPFVALREQPAVAGVRAALDEARAQGRPPESARDAAELAIARAWIAQWLQPMPMPQVIDATGDPVLLVTDHYRVLDAQALASALAAEPDVAGDDHGSWHRSVDLGDGMQRSLAAINPGKTRGRIEVFYRTQRLADDGRAWFERVAGAAVAHLTREITDPAGALAHRPAAGAGKKKPPAQPPLPPEELAQAVGQIMHRHYANWCDEPIPALGGKTPRQAIATRSGLERVKALLRQYEDGEREMAASQGRPPFSYQFLWDALGIER